MAKILTDTRREGQIVWLDTGSFGRTNWTKITITKALKQYVECSNGAAYNLKPEGKMGYLRGSDRSGWSSPSYITTEDMSEAFAAQQAKQKRKDDLIFVGDHLDDLSDEQLNLVLQIVKEAVNDAD